MRKDNKKDKNRMQEENELDDIIMESQIHDLEGVS
jgi:hypothetical protein